MPIIRTIDAHAGGQPLRLIVDGFPSLRGRTMLEKRAWARRHADGIRRAVLLEPRGHPDMCGAVLTEPVTPGAHAGLLFLDTHGYGTISAHTIIAATTIALERELLMPGGDGSAIVYDTPAGRIAARADVRRREAARAPDISEGARRAPVRVAGVSFVNVPSFVLHGGMAVPFAGRSVRADIAFGGAFYAVVDSESAGLPMDAAHVPELRRAGVAIAHAVEAAHRIVHPTEPELAGVEGTVFTGPPDDDTAHLRSVAVFARGQIDRSPCGAAMTAVMAVIDAMGLLADAVPFVQESLIGTRLAGRLESRTMVGDAPAIIAAVDGDAWITGAHTFVVDESDPLSAGFRLV
jgi:proline racemase